MSIRSKVGVILVLTLAIAFLPAVAAFAAGTHASCMGHEASGISPKGTAEEAPGGMPEFKAFVSATFPGAPPGAFFSYVARLHAETHADCDEILDG